MKAYKSKWYHRTSSLDKPVKIMWRYLKENRDLFPLYLFLALVMEIVTMGARIGFSEIIRVIENQQFNQIGLLVIVIIGIDLFQLWIDIAFHWQIIDKLEYTLTRRLVIQTMDKLSTLGVDFYSSVPASIIKSRINKIYTLAGLIQQAGWNVITHSFQIFVSLALIIYYIPNQWGAVLLVLIVYTLAVFVRLNYVMMRKQTPARRRRLDRNEATDEVRDWMIDTHTTLLTNSALGNFSKMLEKNFAAWHKVGMVDFSYAVKGIGLQRDLVLLYGRRASLGFSLVMLINGIIDLPTLVLLNTVVETMFIGMWGITRFLYTFVHESESLIKLDEIMSLEPAIICPKNPIEIPAGAISFELINVCFTYPQIGLIFDEEESSKIEERDNGHLQDVNFKIKAGQQIGLVGPSGAGKTTLASLLLGMRRPSSGDILVNGVSIFDVDPEKFFARVALVPQGTAIDIYNDTLRMNLCLGANYSDAELIDALQGASLLETVQSWPDFLDTKIGERGRTLSGGQQQRVAIARALLRRPDLLVLDEATSSLDPKTEREVQDAIDNLPSDITVVIIAHRLATIRSAHQLVVLENGELIETGSWNHVLANSMLFADMVNLQNLS